MNHRGGFLVGCLWGFLPVPLFVSLLIISTATYLLSTSASSAVRVEVVVVVVVVVVLVVIWWVVVVVVVTVVIVIVLVVILVAIVVVTAAAVVASSTSIVLGVCRGCLRSLPLCRLKCFNSCQGVGILLVLEVEFLLYDSHVDCIVFHW